MDDRWEKEVTEFGAINITGFRVLDWSRKVVRDFIDVWRRDSISVRLLMFLFCNPKLKYLCIKKGELKIKYVLILL